MASLFQKPTTILGVTIPPRRFTLWAALYFLTFFCLPLLGLCFALDFLLYLLFTRALHSCYGVLCFFG